MTADPTERNQAAFIHFFRINIRTFTTLLKVFYNDVMTVDLGATVDEEGTDLASRLTDVSRRVLPALRLYSSWLLSTTNLLAGLSTEESLTGAIDQFWRTYARSVDVIAAVFPIWDLEDLDEVTYCLEEDVDTIGFKPILHERANKIWRNKQTGLLKHRFSDAGVTRASIDEEMLARVKEFLVDGLFLANDDDDAVIKLRGTRILHRDAEDVEPLPVIVPAPPTNVAKVTAKPTSTASPKPLSYAAAAANGSSQESGRKNVANGAATKSAPLSQHLRLSRMVDDLVDDDESNNPVTPPQQHATYPAVVNRDDLTDPTIPDSVYNYAKMPQYSYQSKQPPIGTPAAATPPHRSPKIAITGTPIDRLQTLSSVWNEAPAHQPSSFPTGLPTGTLSSPAQLYSRGHSRVNSASSIRSRTSQNTNIGIADSWSSLEAGSKIWYGGMALLRVLAADIEVRKSPAGARPLALSVPAAGSGVQDRRHVAEILSLRMVKVAEELFCVVESNRT